MRRKGSHALRVTAIVCWVLGVGTIAHAQHPEMNTALLGIVSAPAHRGVEVLHVLEQSPAQEAGLQPGDVLTRIGAKAVSKPEDVDAALAALQPRARLAMEWHRNGKTFSGETNLVHGRRYRATFLRGRPRGEVGFEAPDWYAYAWDPPEDTNNSATRKAPTTGTPPRVAPTRQNTAGKIVVIHAFQSW